MNYIKKLKFNSPVILIFVFISFFAWLLNLLTGGATNRLFFSVYRDSLANPLFYIRLMGHVFGHANWSHFSGNIIIILLIGPLLEEKYGSWNMGIILCVTALTTGIVNVIFFSSALLGASGVVFAFILLSSITRIKDGRIPITFVIVACIYMGGQLKDGILIRDSISNLTHIIGGILGCGFGYILNKK